MPKLDTREVMLGDYAYINHDGDKRIVQIDMNCWRGIRYFLPIPIIEDFLVKNMFHKVDETFSRVYNNKYKLSFNINKGRFTATDNDNEIYFVASNINYVHQFQHAFRMIDHNVTIKI